MSFGSVHCTFVVICEYEQLSNLTIIEFHCNGKWDKNVPAHPGLQIHRCSNNTNIISKY